METRQPLRAASRSSSAPTLLSEIPGTPFASRIIALMHHPNIQALASARARCITKSYDTILMSDFLFVEIIFLNTHSRMNKYNNEKTNYTIYSIIIHNCLSL